MAVLVGGWLTVRMISNAVCSSYNAFSNDLCDRWNWVAPARDGFPLPSRWTIAWDEESCGSGGCLTHLFIVRPVERVGDPVLSYATRVRELGWHVRRGTNPEYRYFVGTKDDLVVSIESAGSKSVWGPRQFRNQNFVAVRFTFIDEGGVLYERATAELH
ncbi:MAG: hypothetical protein M3N24_05165 [Actinomycetota bacterium]|nr:hypothetical protein [Actinomycetota bacterium]